MTTSRLGTKKTDAPPRDRPVNVYMTEEEVNVLADIHLMEADRSGSGVMRRAFGMYVEVKYPQWVKRLREDLRAGGTK